MDSADPPLQVLGDNREIIREIITNACKKVVDAWRKHTLEPLMTPQLAVAARPLQYVATGISERCAAQGSANAGKKKGPMTGNRAKGVPHTGNGAMGVPKAGNAAKGVPKIKARGMCHTGETREETLRRIRELKHKRQKLHPKTGNKARGMCHTGETREEMLIRIRELKY